MQNHLFLMSEATDETNADASGGTSTTSPDASTALGGAASETETPDAWLSEKFRVAKEDGSLDLEASARKQAEAYGHAEKRLATGDVPPKTAEEYTPKIEREGFDWEEFKQDEGTKEFLKGAHAKGMTNAQVEYVLDKYAGLAPDLVQGAAALDAETCVNTLNAEWGEQTQSNLGKAADVATRLGATAEDINTFGNNPAVIRMLVKLSGEMQEGVPPRGAAASQEDLETLMASEAYLNSKHPDHKKTYEQVQKIYSRSIQ